MKTLIIEPSKFSPKIVLNDSGEIIIHGRSIVEDPYEFYHPVLAWIKECDIESVKIEIRLDYMNTSSSKQIFNLLLFVEENVLIKDASVNWFYEHDDEDIFDIGKEFESQLDLTFSFYEFAEAS
jgi:hypothetical protein